MNNCPRRTNAAIEEAVVNAYQIVSVIFHLETGSTQTNVDVLFDSGSVVTLIEQRAIPKNHPILLNELQETKFKPLGGGPYFKSYGIISFQIVRGNKVHDISGYVVENHSLCCKLIIGRDSLDKIRIQLVDLEAAAEVESPRITVDPVPNVV